MERDLHLHPILKKPDLGLAHKILMQLALPIAFLARKDPRHALLIEERTFSRLNGRLFDTLFGPPPRLQLSTVQETFQLDLCKRSALSRLYVDGLDGDPQASLMLKNETWF